MLNTVVYDAIDNNCIKYSNGNKVNYGNYINRIAIFKVMVILQINNISNLYLE